MQNRTIVSRSSAMLRIAIVMCVGSGSLFSGLAAASAAPNPNATCVGLASAYFASVQARDDVAHAIKQRFGIPPGAEVSRFAHVRLGDTAACIENGQSGG